MDVERNDLPKRPDFGPTQVKSPEELVVGKSFVEHYEIWVPGYGWQPRNVEYVIAESPYVDNYGDLVVKVRFTNGNIVKKELDILNLIPQKDGSWLTRTTSWLEDPTKATHPPNE